MNYLYLCDNACFYRAAKTKQIYQIKYEKDVLSNGKVNNERKFYKETYNYLKHNKLINVFLNQKITCVTNPLYLDSDRAFLKDILEKLNYTSIYFKNVLDILDLEDNNFIEYNTNYIFLYYLDEYNYSCFKFIPSNFFEAKSNLYEYIGKVISINNKNIITFGNLVDKEALEKIEKCAGIKIFYVEYPEEYLLNICPI